MIGLCEGVTFREVREDRSCHARCPQRIRFFLGGPFRPSMILGLFLGDGLVMGWSGYFRSRCIPLAISVEDQFLEIVGLDSGLGLETGDIPIIVLPPIGLLVWGRESLYVDIGYPISEKRY